MKKTFYSAITLVFLAGSAAFAQTGNVGIGTPSPQTKLHVLNPGTGGAGVFNTNTGNMAQRLENNQNGQSVIQHFLSKDAAGAKKEFLLGINPTYSGGNGAFYFGTDGGFAQNMQMDLVTGDVGIGVSAATKLHVLTRGTGGTGVFNTNVANTALRLQNDGNGQSVIQHFLTKDAAGATKETILGINPTYNAGEGIFLISRNGSNDLALDLTSGKVGVGTATPIVAFGESAQLSVATASGVGQYIQSSSADLNGLLTLEKTAAATGLDQYVFFKAGGANIGNIVATGPAGVAYNTTSDARLKENIRSTHFGIADVMKIQVRDYNYKKDKNSPQTGFIAQQLYSIFPNAVTKGGEDVSKPWMVDYSKVTPLLTKAIQDQQAEIEALKSQNAGLKAEVSQISQLRDELNSIKASIEKLNGNSKSGQSLAK